MTTFLVLLLIVSPVSSFIMIHNQCKLEKMFNCLNDNIKYLKENSILAKNELYKVLSKDKDVKMSSIEFNTDDED